MNAVIATITPKASAEIIQHLAMLFAGYDVPFGDGSETRKAKVAGYVWACEGRPAGLVERVVKDFLSGKVKRSPSLRSKLPTSEEFAAQLDMRASEGQRGAVVEFTPTTSVPPFGPVWMAKLLSILLAGPEKTKPSAFIAKVIAEGGEKGERYRLQHQATSGFPKAREMLDRADHGQGFRVEEAFEPLAETMEPVPVTSAVFTEWRDDFDRRGWPWLPDTGKQRVVYFPKGGPSGLDVVGAALIRAGGGASELSTSAGDRRGEASA